jgi:uncharacterized protein (UPF0261 family)
MRALPFGRPKVMVSTLASGQVRPFVGGSDILMLYPVADIAGLNRLTRTALSNAAHAIAGMVHGALSAVSQGEDVRPVVAATMFGVTTPCVEHARAILEAEGYEVIVFHATGVGGRSMEGLIRDGLIDGVLDLTTTELADELVGGVLSAGPTRLEAAGEQGVPQVVSLGALDMVNFGPADTVPERFADRNIYVHNPTVTLMRTTPDECRELGRQIGRKLAQANGPVAVYVPLGGISAIAVEGQVFHDAAADAALLEGLTETLPAGVERHDLPQDINDPAFAHAMADRLHELIRENA